MSDDEPFVGTFGEFFGELFGQLAESIWGVVKFGFFAVCVIYPLIWLVGHYGLADATLPPESFEVCALQEHLVGQTDNFVWLKYVGGGELRDVELTVKVSVCNAQYEFKRYKGIWNTNEELQILVPADLRVEQVSISGSATHNGKSVKIKRSGVFGGNLTPATIPVSAIPAVPTVSIEDLQPKE